GSPASNAAHCGKTCPQSLPPGPARSHTDHWRLRNSAGLAGKRSLDCPDAGFPGFLMVADDGGGRSAYCGSRLCSAGCWPPDGPGARGGTAVGGGPALTFAGVLRELRGGARLTPGGLAAAAGAGPRAGRGPGGGVEPAPPKGTGGVVAGGGGRGRAGALGLAGPVAELFVAAARGRGPVQEVVAARHGTAAGAFAAAATRGLPRDVASFTGRRADLDRLVEGLDHLAAGNGVVGICAIDGMAGVGKTTFAGPPAHRLAARVPHRQVYLPFHPPPPRP